MEEKKNNPTTFISKRNHVVGQNGIIEKHFKDFEDFSREKVMIERLQIAGVATPELLSAEDQILRYREIEGTLYADLVECMTVEQATALATWLQDYHNATQELRMDNNLRNYIYQKSTHSCIGIDFESPTRSGYIAEDCGQLIAFTATYNPAFTECKLNTCALLLQAFVDCGVHGDRIESAFAKEITAMCKRRNQGTTLERNALHFYKLLKDKIFFRDCSMDDIEKKILAYSTSQLSGFLHEMEHVRRLATNLFCYKDVRLRIADCGTNNLFMIPIRRSTLEMIGGSETKQEFYMKFLINHMTMGG